MPPWSGLIRGAVLALVALVIPRRVSHLRGYLLALSAMLAGDWLAVELERSSAWFSSATRSQGMLGRVLLSFIPVALMALTTVGSGLRRRDLFLAVGDLRAPAGLPAIRGIRWNVIAPFLLVIISGGLITQLWIVSNASRHYHPALLVAGLPAAVLFAALNSTSEEFRFRNLLLARGSRAIGVAQAIATTSVLFGLAHYGGHPSGISGVAMAGFLAWILARSMVDTGGWGWAWLIHFIQDVIIFLMVVMTGV